MVLKNWKKTRNNKWDVEFIKKDKSDYTRIQHELYLNRFMWSVKTKKVRTEYINTKLQALKFARLYMKKH